LRTGVVGLQRLGKLTIDPNVRRREGAKGSGVGVNQKSNKPGVSRAC